MESEYETLSSASESQDEDEVFDVEAIRKWRYNRATKRREFLIKWRNYPDDENTWEPESNLDCKEKMDQFIAGLSRRQKRLFNKNKLESLNGLERNADIVSIEGDEKSSKISLLIKDGTTISRQISNDDRSRFVLKVVFHDNEQNAEELSLDQLYQHQPEKAFEWIEQRLISKEPEAHYCAH